MCVTSCSNRHDNRSNFYAMEKLLYKDDSIAQNFLDTINISSFFKNEQPYCELLKIQATDLTDNDIKIYEREIESIIKYMRYKKDNAFLNLAYYYAGRIKHEKRNAIEAFKYYNLAISNDNLYGLNSRSYAQMADIYYEQYLYDYSIEMYNKAYNEAKKDSDTVGMAKILKDKALVFLEENKGKTSLIFLEKALKIAKATNDKSCINSVESYFAMAYINMKDWKSADKILSHLIKNINKADTSAYYYIAANIYRHTNKDKARYFYNYLKANGEIYAKEDAYSFFAEESIIRKEYNKAVDYFNKYKQTIDSIRATTNSEMLAKIKGLYDYQRQEAEIAKISKERNEFRLWCFRITTLFIAIGTFAVFMIVRLKRKAKEEKRQVFMLKKLQTEIRKNSEEKMQENGKRIEELELQLKNINNEKADLQKILEEEREKLLAQNAISQIKAKEKNQAIANIKNSEIGMIVHKKSANDVKTHLTLEEKQKLEETFDAFMPSFKEKLWSVYDISTKELNVCMLTKLDYKPADIANLLGCTPSAISKIRTRLYNKFFHQAGTAEEWDKFILSL